ncbi:hypothetical protein TWF569_004912 [Orbilia oligospora]|uniref:Uncharacterized protein n=1 Tax=Orbilia oligospora TaxID=2813651 RepID=A0A7C8NCN2_ORBOL|nr:hypothetical protein TWF103_009693 [Orbilia oligospora]KAF3097079.1 hypothetical protein TWF102_006514 [Orbilia oligospora]KAF3110241.1 hypothetical protein TWF706_000963 [Orbilia oligospora]KAF3118729.1 hypothetical protein TWF569_004912 [Orbilia oligospora]KAF3131040.1 hypothetical protein TWF594_010115 [Orbilia oligospora]
MASATYCDMPVVIDGYEAAKERQRYLIEKMEALDMTLWLARIPSDQRFYYPGKLIRDDDDNMETEILDIMREIEDLQEIVDIYEDVDEDLEWEVDEEALREFERLTRGRKAELTIPIPEGALSRNPSPCSRTWVPRPAEPDFEKPFNPFREEYFLGLEDAITDETEFITIPGAAPHSLSTISHNSLFGDLVDYVREWNPFDVGSSCTSRSSSMDSTFSFNEMVSDSSVSSDAGDDCSVRKTSDENTKTTIMETETMTVPLVLDDGRFNTAGSRRSSEDSQGPWPEYLEYEMDVDEEMDYDDYYEYEEMAHQTLVHTTAKYADLGSSLLNSTFDKLPTNNIIYTERALSECSTISDSEPCTPTTINPHMIHIELPAYKVDYYLAFEDAEDQFIRTKFLGKNPLFLCRSTPSHPENKPCNLKPFRWIKSLTPTHDRFHPSIPAISTVCFCENISSAFLFRLNRRTDF